MTRENQPTTAPGFSRRTALKAAAWSAPVIAAASAVPAHAASAGQIDLSLSAIPAGDIFSAFSPDRLRSYSLALPGGYSVKSEGGASVAAGSALIVSFDARILGVPTVRADQQDGPEITRVDHSTNGDVGTATFSLPAIVDGELLVFIDYSSLEVDWYDDVNPLVFTVTPVAGSDPDLSNNTVTSSAHYVSTNDGAVDVAWGTQTIPNEGDPAAPFVIDVPEIITLRSIAPGGTSPEISFTIGGPQVLVPVGDSSEWQDAFESITITSAQLDGVDVLSDVKEEIYVGNIWLRNTPMSAGQTLVLTVNVSVTPTAVHAVYPTGGSRVQSRLSDDRDRDNDSAFSPQYEV